MSDTDPTSDSIFDAYAVLGADPATASAIETRAAYRKLILLSHPDTEYDVERKHFATEKTLKLIEAYETLKKAGFPQYVSDTRSRNDPNPPWQKRTTSGQGLGQSAWMSVDHIDTEFATYFASWGSSRAYARAYFDALLGLVPGLALIAMGTFGLLASLREGFSWSDLFVPLWVAFGVLIVPVTIMLFARRIRYLRGLRRPSISR